MLTFDDTIADMLSYKQLSPIVNELFIRGRKQIIYLVFITQTYFADTNYKSLLIRLY